MTQLLRRIASKLLAVALLLGAAALVFLIAVEPLATRFRDARDRISAERVLLGRLETQAATSGAPAGSGSRNSAIESGRGLMLAGASDAVRIAGLQDLLGRLAEGEGIVVRSTRPLPIREQDGLRLLGIEAQLNAELTALQRLLHGLESGTPLLLAETLHIMPPAVLNADNPEAGTALEVRLGLFGAAPRPKE